MRVYRRWTISGAAAVVAAAVAIVPAGPAAAQHIADNHGCTDYGEVLEARDGFIPRDDLSTPRRDALATWVADHPRAAKAARAANEPIRVPVAFHVIRKGTSLALGNLSRAAIEDQMQVLNDSFAGATAPRADNTGFRFDLVDVTRTTQPQWFNLIPANGDERRLYRGSGKEVKMKQALRVGGPETLNIYSAKLGQFLLGFAYFPEDFVGKNGLPRYLDGVVIDYRSVPGGAFTNYDGGDTAPHEVGHWLGLYHTFANGCEEPGDHVDDTAYEASPATQCPKGRDTCAQPGLDPITNFMDYTYDACMNKFSDGQGDRMRDAWAAFRR